MAIGLSKFWALTRKWLFSKNPISAPSKKQPNELKQTCSDLILLDSYRGAAPVEFWSKFPFAPIPSETRTRINRQALENLIDKWSPSWSHSKRVRSQKLMNDLWHGGSAYQSEILPPITVKNAESAFMHGALLTEKIASWVESGYVAGPFEYAPFPGFRSNSLMEMDRNDKIRPVINMSGPKNSSFNSNILAKRMEKVRMSTAKSFGYDVREAGKNALMSKFDLKDAFKLIPARQQDWKLQGFSWLGRSFFETQMIFGARPSVSNFDRLGKTVVELAKSSAGLNSVHVHRTLDDIPIVGPENSGITELLSKAVKAVCEEAEIPLAENDEKKEKAFFCEKTGIVLGIGFRTEDASWFISEQKGEKIMSSIYESCCKKYISLNEIQKLMGQLNDLAQMCPFLKMFLSSGYSLLASFKEDYGIVKLIEDQVKKDWLICFNAAKSAKKGLPLQKRPSGPPLGAMSFYTDAAGCKFNLVNGVRINQNKIGDRGAACTAYMESELVWFCSFSWPMKFLEDLRDEKGAFYGSKMSTLECIGVLLPFLTNPSLMMGKCVVFFTDNLPLVYGFESKNIKFDKSATALIRAIGLMSAYLGCRVWVSHTPRMSCEKAVLADHLSRQSSTTDEEKTMLSFVSTNVLEGVLINWLNNPVDCASLPELLLQEVESKIVIP